MVWVSRFLARSLGVGFDLEALVLSVVEMLRITKKELISVSKQYTIFYANYQLTFDLVHHLVHRLVRDLYTVLYMYCFNRNCCFRVTLTICRDYIHI